MKQPVKKAILEINPYLQQEETEYILIVDANGLLKGSLIESPLNSNGVRIKWVMNFLWKIKTMLHKRPFSKVYCVWDGKNSGILRYEIYPDYKKSRKKNYSEYDRKINAFVFSMLERQKAKEEELAKQKDKEKYLQNQQRREQESEDFEKTKLLLQELLEYLFIRQIQDDAEGTESDDIIAYIVLNKLPNQKVYIITGDSDIHQLISDDVAIYDFKRKDVYHIGNYQEKRGMPIENILISKILCGDNSDDIRGVKGLGEKTREKYYPELNTDIFTVEKLIEKTKLLIENTTDKNALKVFNKIIEEYNDGSFELKEKIINLKKPLIGNQIKDELDELMESPLDPCDRDFENVYRIVIREELIDLQGNNFSSFFLPFKRLIEKEKLFYKKSGFTYIEQ